MITIKQFLHSFIFWGAWIIIPVLMEIVPSVLGFLMILRRRARNHRQRKMSPAKPEISLIIPVYNSAGTLEACIRSIDACDYPDDRIRIYLVNNMGKDNSFEIFTKCQQLYPKLRMQWLNAKQGKSRALNLALYNSDGKYIMNLDSDGILEPHALSNMVMKFEANPELNCMTGAILIEPRLIEEYKGFFPRLLRKMEFMEYAQAFLAGRSYASETNSVYTLSGAFSAFRKSAILSSNLYNTNTICEDTQMTFQMRYMNGERVEVCENALFFVDPIEGLNKLYTQRQRWQRGSLEVARQFLNKNDDFGKSVLDVNVRTLLYDHTFAFPRMIWYLALICLIAMNYSGYVILISTGVIMLLYVMVGYLYFMTSSFFLKEFEELHHYYVSHWWVIPFLPLFNFFVFFIRLSGVINSINTDSAWKTRNFTDEKRAFSDVIRGDFHRFFVWREKLRSLVNVKEES
ncbi:MAG: putative glycosyltransferase, exosortase G system-associated [Lachnospiraceae bacterium]|nr:putative glycosyltransferase, exosortase G system-associated [Lachnospiraceae bacterium]